MTSIRIAIWNHSVAEIENCQCIVDIGLPKKLTVLLLVTNKRSLDSHWTLDSVTIGQCYCCDILCI